MMKQLKTLAILSLALTLSACGSSETANTEAPAEEQQTQEAASPETAEPVKEEEPANQLPAFEPYTVIDNDECTVTVKEVKLGDKLTAKFMMENKSDSAEYSFDVWEVSVNGISLDSNSYSLGYKTLPAGKKANETLTISKNALKDFGVDQDFTDLEIRMTVRDYNDYEADAVADERFHIYPYGEDKAVKYVYEPADNHHVLVDNDDVKIVQTGFDKANNDNYYAYAFRFYIENKTDTTLNLYAEDAYINGYQVYPYIQGNLGAGKACFTAWYIDQSQLTENDIETIEEAEVDLSIYDYDSYDNVFSDTLTLVP